MTDAEIIRKYLTRVDVARAVWKGTNLDGLQTREDHYKVADAVMRYVEDVVFARLSDQPSALRGNAGCPRCGGSGFEYPAEPCPYCHEPPTADKGNV